MYYSYIYNIHILDISSVHMQELLHAHTANPPTPAEASASDSGRDTSDASALPILSSAAAAAAEKEAEAAAALSVKGFADTPQAHSGDLLPASRLVFAIQSSCCSTTS